MPVLCTPHCLYCTALPVINAKGCLDKEPIFFLPLFCYCYCYSTTAASTSIAAAAINNNNNNNNTKESYPARETTARGLCRSEKAQSLKTNYDYPFSQLKHGHSHKNLINIVTPLNS